MMSKPILTEATIRNLTTTQSFSRGQAYLRDGAVLEIEQRGDLLQAEVEGSEYEFEADTVVYVRAHLNPGGYGGQAFKGSARSGFEPVDLAADFAAGLTEEDPLPQGCAF